MLTAPLRVRDVFPCVYVCVCLWGGVTYTTNAQLQETYLNLLTIRLLTQKLYQFRFPQQLMRFPVFHPIANT